MTCASVVATERILEGKMFYFSELIRYLKPGTERSRIQPKGTCGTKQPPIKIIRAGKRQFI